MPVLNEQQQQNCSTVKHIFHKCLRRFILRKVLQRYLSIFLLSRDNIINLKFSSENVTTGGRYEVISNK